MRPASMMVSTLAATALAHDSFEGPKAQQGLHHRLAARVSALGFKPASTQNNMCLDVKDNNLANGARVQLWSCSGGQNQLWRIEGPLFQTANNLCLDLPSGYAANGVKLQVWTCDGSNKNQWWSPIGSTLQWGGGGSWCLDVTDGNFNNGNELQLWTCYPGSANQAIKIQSGGNTDAMSQAEAASCTDYLGYPVISLEAFVQKYPECAPYEGALLGAGSDQGISPVFLGAIAMVESDCGAGLANSPNAWAGPFQFMDVGAANFYVGAGKSVTNFWDAAYGAARYFHALLIQNGNDLNQAMRSWNGPVEWGGDPNYQSHVFAYMAGEA